MQGIDYHTHGAGGDASGLEPCGVADKEVVVDVDIAALGWEGALVAVESHGQLALKQEGMTIVQIVVGNGFGRCRDGGVEFVGLDDLTILQQAPCQIAKGAYVVGMFEGYLVEDGGGFTFLSCTDEILRGLGEMYVSDERFRKNIDKAGGNGTAEFVAAAIKEYCK